MAPATHVGHLRMVTFQIAEAAVFAGVQKSVEQAETRAHSRVWGLSTRVKFPRSFFSSPL